MELQLLLLGAENTFITSFFYLPPIVQRGPLNVFPFLLLAYCRLQSERADEEPFHGLAWPGLQETHRHPYMTLGTVHTYCPRTAVTACNALPGCWLLAALSHTACTSHDTGTVASGNSAHPPANHPIHPPTRPSARPSPSSLAYRSWW